MLLVQLMTASCGADYHQHTDRMDYNKLRTRLIIDSLFSCCVLVAA